MTTVAKILAAKRDQSVHTISPDSTALNAAKLMAEKSVGGLVVTEGERIVGIVTERDYARKLVPMNRSSSETSVREIMSSPVMYVRPDQTRDECMALVTENRLRHLPVIDDGKLIGLISIGDLVKNTICEQEFLIDQLQHYIRGDLG
ncbi:MAG: putative signal-transduction protein with domain [Burkholderiaceae bacterium]|nr:putative signal-transduction protein with domain [Burkholderiaceae bacterium]